MSLDSPPAFHSLASYFYSARSFRRVFESLLGDGEGVVAPGDLVVAPTSPASMSVTVAAGRAFIRGDSVARQGVYFAENTATLTVGPLAAAHASLGRIDLVVLEDLDSSPDGGSAVADLQRVRIITGTPGGSPAAPALPVNAIALAQVLVAAAATSIGSGAITDRRPVLASGLVAPWVEAVGAPTVSTATVTAPNFTAVEQRGGVFNSGAANVLVIPDGLGGVYTVSAAAVFAGSASGLVRSLELRVNGAIVAADTKVPQNAAFGVHADASAPLLLEEGDEVSMRVYQDTGGDLAATCTLRMARIGG